MPLFEIGWDVGGQQVSSVLTFKKKRREKVLLSSVLYVSSFGCWSAETPTGRETAPPIGGCMWVAGRLCVKCQSIGPG